MSNPDILYAGLVGACVALLGVIVAQITNFLIQGRARRWELEDRKQLRVQSNGEELFVSLSRWFRAAFMEYTNYSLVMAGKIDYNAALDRTIERGEKQNFDADRISLLFAVHFPELSEEWHACQSAVFECSRIESEFRGVYKMGVTYSPEHLEEYSAAISKANELQKSLSHHLAEHIQKHVSPERI